jgi:hypothetical protein
MASWSVVANSDALDPAVSAGADDAVYIADVSINHSQVRLWNGSVLTDDLTVATSLLRDVWAASPNDVWAVGPGSWHRDASGWTKVTTPLFITDFNPLTALWRLAPNDVIASTAGELVRWDGSAWSELPPALPATTAIDVVGIYAASDNDIWAVGSFQASGQVTALKHWDGTGWTFYGRQRDGWGPGTTTAGFLALRPYTGIWGTSANDIWAVGSSGPARAIHYDGTRWSDVALPGLPADASLVDVWSACPSDVWISGWSLAAFEATHSNSYVFHFDGQTWSPEPGPADEPLALTGSASAVWIVGQTAIYTRPR